MNKTKFSHKLLATLLSVLMVISVFPVVQAATDNHPDAVTITVVDEDTGKPIEDAKVSFVIYDNDLGYEVKGDDDVLTDADGVIEVCDSASVKPGVLKISSVKVTHDDYETYENTAYDQVIDEVDANYTIKVKSIAITDVEIKANTLMYNGQPQELVSVTEIEGDTITYELNGTPVTEKPMATDAGTYTVKVTVSRQGKNDLVKIVEVKIDPADMGIDIKAIAGLQYDGNPQKLVELTGNFEDTDTVTWLVNGVDTGSRDIPKVSEVGTHKVQLIVDRPDDNYADFNKIVTVEIALGVIDISGLAINANDREYDGTEEDLIIVKNKGDYTLKYSEDNQVTWQDDIPKATDAGTYKIYVKAVKEGYNEQNTEAFPIEVTISKRTNTLTFDTTSGLINPTKVSGKQNEFPKTFTIKATDVTGRTDIKYSVALADSESEFTIDQVATIDETIGELTLTGKDSVVVTATLPETANEKGATVSYTIAVEMYPDNQGEWVAFEKTEVNYTVGTAFEENKAENQKNALGKRKYYIEDESGNLVEKAYGLKISSKIDGLNYQPVLEIKNMAQLVTALETNGGTLSVKIWVEKDRFGSFAKDKNFYTLNITFANTPDNAYTVAGDVGTNNWYQTNVTVTPAAGYQITTDISNGWSDSVVFSDQGQNDRFVYLKKVATGGITSRIAIVDENNENLKIDTVAPSTSEMNIVYTELNFIQEILADLLGFYNPSVTIKFTAKDATSGISHIMWKYTKQDGASDVNAVSSEYAKLAVVEENGIPTATLTLTADELNQYRGNLSFYAVDNAGNESEKVNDNYIFVVDTIEPEFTRIQCNDKDGYADAACASVGVKHYFAGDVNVKFSIKEANFYSEDVTVLVSKNGGREEAKEVEWLEANGDVHTATFTLSGDGEYVVSVNAKDKSKNPMTPFKSEVIVIDATKPIFEVEYNTPSSETGYYYNSDIIAKLTITERNFNADAVVVKVSKDGGEEQVANVEWTSAQEDKYTATLTLTDDGDYKITVNYTDYSNNKMNDYSSAVRTIDKTKPEIKVEYTEMAAVNTLADIEDNTREYYDDTREATITITEHNFDADDVKFTILAKDVTGADLVTNEGEDVIAKLIENGLVEMTDWQNNGDIHIITITYPGDANYTFDVEYSDEATNAAEDYAEDYFTVDTTAPTNIEVKYSTSVYETILESITFGFYNAKMTVEVFAEDEISEIHSFNYSYLKADGTSDVNAELVNQTISAEDIKYSEDRKNASATFEIPKLILGLDNQFNGTVEFNSTDRAGNTPENQHKETKRIVVDSIAPTVQITYNEPINVVGDISYYDGDINATIVVNEANFDSTQVAVKVAKDGAAPVVISPNWTDNSVDVHTGTFTLTEDGHYVVTVEYADYSGNKMVPYTSNQLTIDTQIEAPVYTINGVAKSENGGAYKEAATIGFSFTDENFDTNTIKLVRTRFNKVEDVTSAFVKAGMDAKGGAGSFSIPAEVGNDGIYVLTIGMTDKALHTTESKIKFTINRFGSVYEYNDDLMALIKDGGQYVTSVGKDLVITEYNASPILENSLKILVTRDGEPVDVDFTSTPQNINAQVSVGSSGWYQYVYTIKAANFAKDGVYKISLASEYSTNDAKNNGSTSVPENSIDSQGSEVLDTMTFTVDSVAPEIRNITNLDEKIPEVEKIQDGKLNVKYTVVDVGGLKSIEVVLNGETIQTLTAEDFADDAYNYSGSFDIAEQDKTTAQKIQIKVTDLAGNVTDTDSEDFLNAHSNKNEEATYVFFNEITVSRNFLVRWYANTALFWGSIGGTVVLVGAVWFFIAKKKKREED